MANSSSGKKIDEARKRIDDIVVRFGVETLNLVIRRHHLSSDKRNFFIVRYAETDSDKENEYTQEMNRLTEKISIVDEQLYRKGIEKDWRLSILRDIKKVFPGEWEGGFSLERLLGREDK